MNRQLDKDLDKLLATMARLFGEEGSNRELAVLAYSKASIEETDYDNWDGGQHGFTITLEVPDYLYSQLGDGIGKLEQDLTDRANQVCRHYRNQSVAAFTITAELTADERWREKAQARLKGEGVSNQGRARSDNVAPIRSDGLLFRSPPEVNLYRALKALGVTFAPLPVFVRGGSTYRRIEPDFVLVKDGMLMVVEVDGDTIHRESPLEAHDRTTLLVHEGAHVERVNAKECATLDEARECARRMVSVLQKLKANR